MGMEAGMAICPVDVSDPDTPSQLSDSTSAALLLAVFSGRGPLLSEVECWSCF